VKLVKPVSPNVSQALLIHGKSSSMLRTAIGHVGYDGENEDEDDLGVGGSVLDLVPLELGDSGDSDVVRSDTVDGNFAFLFAEERGARGRRGEEEEKDDTPDGGVRSVRLRVRMFRE
jgi:hypothetical protein